MRKISKLNEDKGFQHNEIATVSAKWKENRDTRRKKIVDGCYLVHV